MKFFTLITGASNPFGIALAKAFAARNHHLVLITSTEDELAPLAAELRLTHQIEIYILAADLSARDIPMRIYTMTKQLGLQVDILVNNQGSVLRSEISNLKTDLQSVQLNVHALIELTSLFTEDMSKIRRGKILNVLPDSDRQNPVSAGTKAFISQFSKTLNCALPSGISVSVLNLKSLNNWKADDFASVTCHKLEKGQSIIKPGIWDKISLRFSRITMPRFMKKLFKKPLTETK